MALRIHLVNMPFADACRPSIALTQLKAALERAYHDKVSVQIAYLNHEFARLMGSGLYDFVALSAPGHISGLGEWLFRSVAFPEAGDNATPYLSRYRYQFDRDTQQLLEAQLVPFRNQLRTFLDQLILRYRLHEADVVGLTSMFFQNLPSIALAQRLRRVRDKQFIVMGGANCEATMGIELVTNVKAIDFVFSGPSLLSFTEFVGHVLNEQPDKCHAIDGVFSRQNARSADGEIKRVEDVVWSTFKPEQLLKGVASLGRDQDINASPELNYDGFSTRCGGFFLTA